MKYIVWGLIFGFVFDIILWGYLATVPSWIMLAGFFYPLLLIACPIIGGVIGNKLDNKK